MMREKIGELEPMERMVYAITELIASNGDVPPWWPLTLHEAQMQVWATDALLLMQGEKEPK